MALPVEYVVRETAGNIRRNLTLSIATFLTMAVSLTLFGAAFLVRYAVDHATAAWRGNIEFIVYLKPLNAGGSTDQWSAIERDLKASPKVKSFVFFDQQAAYKEYKEYFKDAAQIDVVKAEDLPPSYRVVPKDASELSVRSMVAEYQKKAGVYSVVTALDTVKSINRTTDLGRTAILVVSLCSLFAATLLIGNTIRTAIFARRREIEVMKLVGATNWFIRVPFMLEGMFQGLVGAAFAVGGVWGFKALFLDRLQGKSNSLTPGLLLNFVVSSGQLTFTAVVLLALGGGIGTISSAVAIGRFLDV